MFSVMANFATLTVEISSGYKAISRFHPDVLSFFTEALSKRIAITYIASL